MSKMKLPATMHTQFLVVTALLTIAGCTKKSGLDVVEVYGTVTYGGEPIEDGKIRFVPMRGTKGPTSGADIEKGKYRVTNRGGVPVGAHKVRIFAHRPDEDAEPIGDNVPGFEPGEFPPEQYLPAKYNDKTELTTEIPAGEREVKRDYDLD